MTMGPAHLARIPSEKPNRISLGYLSASAYHDMPCPIVSTILNVDSDGTNHVHCAEPECEGSWNADEGNVLEGWVCSGY